MLLAVASPVLGQTTDTLRLVPQRVSGKATARWRVQRSTPNKSLTKEQQQTLSLDVRDVPLTDVVLLLQRRTNGVGFVIRSGAKTANDAVTSPYSAVTLRLTERPLADVVQAVAQSAGAAVTWQDGTYVFGPLPPTPRAAPAHAP